MNRKSIKEKKHKGDHTIKIKEEIIKWTVAELMTNEEEWMRPTSLCGIKGSVATIEINPSNCVQSANAGFFIVFSPASEKFHS